MRNPSPTLKAYLFLLLILLFTWSCNSHLGAPGSKEAGSPPGEAQNDDLTFTQTVVPPRYSLWAPFDTRGGEPAGFAMYTYVLLGRELSPEAEPDHPLRLRYESLLREIASSTIALKSSTGWPREETNLFCFPALDAELFAESRGGLENGSPLAIYDFDLSMHYLARTAGALLRESSNQGLGVRLLNRPGPFLISVLKPLPEWASESHELLFWDLSTTHPDAMGEVVAAYKKRVHSEPVEIPEEMKPFRVRLLSIILTASENVGLVRIAIQSWFGSEE